MDILRVLAAPDVEVRRKTLALALDLVHSRNVDEMVIFLRKVSCVFCFIWRVLNVFKKLVRPGTRFETFLTGFNNILTRN